MASDTIFCLNLKSVNSLRISAPSVTGHVVAAVSRFYENWKFLSLRISALSVAGRVVASVSRFFENLKFVNSLRISALSVMGRLWHQSPGFF